MATKAGVWIDHKQATVVLITNEGLSIKKVKSDIEQIVQPGRSSRPSNKYTPNDFIAEDRRERKLVDGRKKVYEQVLDFVRGAHSLLILGPGEAKGEFSKYVKRKRLRGVTLVVEATDKLTDRQLATRVRKHFNITSAGKAATEKAKTTKASTIATGKGSKKSKK